METIVRCQENRKMFRIAVCDDEEYFRIREKKLIGNYMDKQGYSCLVDSYPSGKEMLNAIGESLQYDIIFLDVSMEEMDGIETARRIRRITEEVDIVFVSAYITYALDGYKVNAIRYLLKEENGLGSALKECLDVVTARIAQRKTEYEITFLNGKKSVPVDTVLYVESRLHKVMFFVMENETIKEYCKYGKLDSVQGELEQYGFCRVHQSYLVNMKYVKNVERYEASLENGMTINISKRYYKDAEREYIKRQGEI